MRKARYEDTQRGLEKEIALSDGPANGWSSLETCHEAPRTHRGRHEFRSAFAYFVAIIWQQLDIICNILFIFFETAQPHQDYTKSITPGGLARWMV